MPWCHAPAVNDVPPTRDFATYQRETVRRVLERQAGVFTLVLAVSLALDAYRLHPSHAFAVILERLPVQIAVCALVFLALRYTRVGARFPTWLGGIGYATLAGIGGTLLGDLGGFDGPFFYAAYVLPTFIMVLPCTFKERLAMTLSSVAAFLATFFVPHPAHLDDPFAHIGLAYLAVITGVNLFFGHRTMLLLRERFMMERSLERHGEQLAEDKRALEARVREQTGSVHGLLDRLDTARHETRTALARDLHDGMGQLVAGTRLELAYIERVLDTGKSLSTENLGYLYGLVDRLDRQVRQLVCELRDPANIDRLDVALLALRDAYAGMPGMNVAVDVALPFEPSSSLGEVIVAVTREALTNAAKHARASHIGVRVDTQDGRLVLEVVDDGLGLPDSTLAATGFGIAGMRERVEQVGGEFGIESPRPLIGGGTRLWARFAMSGHEGLMRS